MLLLIQLVAQTAIFFHTYPTFMFLLHHLQIHKLGNQREKSPESFDFFQGRGLGTFTVKSREYTCFVIAGQCELPQVFEIYSQFDVVGWEESVISTLFTHKKLISISKKFPNESMLEEDSNNSDNILIIFHFKK